MREPLRREFYLLLGCIVAATTIAVTTTNQSPYLDKIFDLFMFVAGGYFGYLQQPGMFLPPSSREIPRRKEETDDTHW